MNKKKLNKIHKRTSEKGQFNNNNNNKMGIGMCVSGHSFINAPLAVP